MPTQHPVGSAMHRREGQRGGRPAGCRPPAAALRHGQGTEFSRSFRKLSGSVISDNRPGKQRRRWLEQERTVPSPPESRLWHPRRAHTVRRRVRTRSPPMTVWTVIKQTHPFCEGRPAPEPAQLCACAKAVQRQRVTSVFPDGRSKPKSVDTAGLCRPPEPECAWRAVSTALGTFSKEAG